MAKIEILDERRKCFLWFPIGFTVYKIIKKDGGDVELYAKTGLLNVNEEKIKLYKINDVNYSRSLGNLLFGVGNIKISSSDKSTKGNFVLKKIKKAKLFQENLEELVEQERQKNNIVYKETEIL